MANLILVGPMGAGKTTIGRRLATALQWAFCDSDREIERRTGVSIPLIFELEGEAGFRAREKTVLEELCRRQSTVIATGGGAVLDAANRRCLKASGRVIYLRVSVDEQLRRLARDNQRPLLQTDDPRRRLETLAAQREPLYREIADWVVTTDDQGATHVVQQLLKLVAREVDSQLGNPP
ncbi:MAG: shikimate kinase AroK [Candidatus Competibacterales bacterium]